MLRALYHIEPEKSRHLGLFSGTAITWYTGSMELKISRVHPDARIPEYKTEGAACFDLESIEEVDIIPGETKFIRTGLIFVIPKEYFLCVAPRSSFSKTGLIMPHSFGILDPDFSGPKDEMLIIVKNIASEPVKVEKFQRLAQCYVAQAPRVTFKEVHPSKLSKKSRGGIGSTGPK